MAISKPEKHANEVAIFSYRAEAGLQEMRKWLYGRRDEIAEKWIDLTGDELTQMQGEARSIRKQIKMIDQGPVNKETAQ